MWLDVDELDDLAKLEGYVHSSALLLAFLSKGYFLSANCQRELHAAIGAQPMVPLILVQELDLRRGGVCPHL